MTVGWNLLPTEWSKEIGIFLGYVVGDGTFFYQKRERDGGLIPMVRVGATEADVGSLHEVAAWVTSWTGEPSNVTERPVVDSARDHARMVSSGLAKETTAPPKRFFVVSWRRMVTAKFLESLGIDKVSDPSNRRLPSSLWDAPLEAQAGFVSGFLSTDGNVSTIKRNEPGRNRNTTRTIVTLAQVSKGMLEDVQKILLDGFGIRSTVGAYHAYNRRTAYRPMYYLQITDKASLVLLWDKVGIHNARKEAILVAADLVIHKAGNKLGTKRGPYKKRPQVLDAAA